LAASDGEPAAALPTLRRDRTGYLQDIPLTSEHRGRVQNRTDVSLSYPYTPHEVQTTVLIAVALVLAVGITVVLRQTLAGGRPELGSVSEQWLSEYRRDELSPPR
jgi:hypothetical protein